MSEPSRTAHFTSACIYLVGGLLCGAGMTDPQDNWYGWLALPLLVLSAAVFWRGLRRPA